MDKTGTIVLPNLATAAIFDHELQGQFSDGMWENARPYEHWKFWCGLVPRVESDVSPRVDSAYKWMCRKNSYNLTSLLPIVGERMLKMGRMAKAAEAIGKTQLSYNEAHASEYMPDTYEEFEAGRAKTAWGNAYVKHVSRPLAQAFYEATYTLKELKTDLKVIKIAMKSVNNA